MKQTLKRLMTGTRELESRLTTAFEQAAQTVAGSGAPAPPLEVIDQAVDEIGKHVQPAGRGRYTFPFNRVTITFVAPTPEDEARFEAICEGPPSIGERVQRRLASAGCDGAEVDVHVEFTAALPAAGLPARDIAIGESGVNGLPTGGSLAQESGNGTPRGTRPALPRLFDIALARVKTAPRTECAPATSLHLTVLHGAAGSGEYTFTTFPVAIGRGADVRDSRSQLLRINHVAFVEGDNDVNRTVSRRHARIELDDRTGRVRIVDDNSAQGTSIVRGSRGIAVPRGSRGLGLQTDDEIVVGQARIKVKISAPAAASARTAPRSRP